METNAAPREAIAFSSDAADLRIVADLRIAIVSGVRFLREGLADLFARDPHVCVVRLCADLFEAAALGPALDADIVLLDARVAESAAAVRRAIETVPGMRVVVIAVQETEDDIIAWAEAGVIGYVPSTAALNDLVRLVFDIHSGRQVCSSRVAAGLLRRIALGAVPASGRDPSRNGASPAPVLTRRERQAAQLIMTGLSDKEIARQLNISLATTKSHVHNLLGKLNLQRRSQVAKWLREHEHRAPDASPRPPGRPLQAGAASPLTQIIRG